jgi:AcrR family transcriptional regulator
MKLPDLPSPFDAQPEDTRGRIMAAAAQVFAGQGYARATTRQIAAAAGVTEVTIFRHFGSKENLFTSILEAFGAPQINRLIEARLSGDCRQDLRMIGGLYLHFMLERADLIRLMLCEAAHFPEARRLAAQNPRHLRQTLAAYFKRQMAAGAMRQNHPEALAQAFIGMFFAYATTEGILHQGLTPHLSPEEIVELFVGLFIEGTTDHRQRTKDDGR